ncbi:MAG: OsmC family protein [Anaerolineales bacterium]|nr:OsmC family protein [Anaerolineales bacterium]
MDSIESLGQPLAYKVSDEGFVPEAPGQEGMEQSVRLEARALEGMQKEALVFDGSTGSVWRMVSDEGPYLNGKDMAPFPLAFYSAGMASSFLAELIRHAQARGVALTNLSIVQDSYYTMEGSAIRGDMTGGAIPAEIVVNCDSGASQEEVEEVVQLARASSPAQSYMHDVLRNTFSLASNGNILDVEQLTPSAAGLQEDPEGHFAEVKSQPPDTFFPDIIVKLSSAETVFGVEGGAGSSLHSEQKRTLHVRAIAAVREDGLYEIKIQLFKPIGSTFRFISDVRGGLAPPPLAYLSAGVGFCYMTQLGRYATIVKQELKSYRIVQENRFEVRGSYEGGTATAAARPVDTQLFVTMEGSDEEARRLLQMGEQTCFLHAAMRSSNQTKLNVQRVEAEVDLENPTT